MRRHLYHGAMKSVPRPLRLPEVKTDVSVRGTLNVLLAAAWSRRCRIRVVFVGLWRPGAVPALGGPGPLRRRTRPANWQGRSSAAPGGYPTACPLSPPGTSTCTDRSQDPISGYGAVVPRFTMALPVGGGAGHPRRRRAGAGLCLHPRRRRGEPPYCLSDASLVRASGERRGWSEAEVGERAAGDDRRLTNTRPEPLHEPSEGDIRLTSADFVPGTRTDWLRTVGRRQRVPSANGRRGSPIPCLRKGTTESGAAHAPRPGGD
jgi:hypothetical protein